MPIVGYEKVDKISCSKPIVNITMRSVEWYESYLDAMKLAKDVVEREEKAAAEELQKSLGDK